MQIPAQCPRCREVAERRQSLHEVSSGQRKYDLPTVLLAEMPPADVHSGKLTVRCDQGHVTAVTLPIPLFELLFDFGCSALLDGYPREAVTNFATSFERFQEFGCRLLLARRDVSLDGIDAWWKEVATSSERQLGSFVALWIAEFRSPPPILPRKLVEFRNDCVHKGYIPPDASAKDYGEAVLCSVVEGIVKLRNCFDDQLEYDDFVEHYVVRAPENEPLVMSFLANTVISGMWRPNEHQPDAEDREEREQSQRTTRTQKNTTDPGKLTMDGALRVFAGLRSLGARRK